MITLLSYLGSSKIQLLLLMDQSFIIRAPSNVFWFFVDPLYHCSLFAPMPSNANIYNMYVDMLWIQINHFAPVSLFSGTNLTKHITILKVL